MRYIIALLFFVISYGMNAQNRDVSIEITVQSTIEFYFNSLTAYSTGVYYPNFSQLEIQSLETTGAATVVSSRWTLEVVSMSADIVGDETGTLIPLGFLEFDATWFSGLTDGFVIYYSNIPLSIGGSLIIDNGRGIFLGDLASDPKKTKVNISYHCGRLGTASLYPSDYYTVNVFFRLTMK